VNVPSSQTLTVISDFGDWQQGFTHSTLVLPDPTAIDTFRVPARRQTLVSSKMIDDCESLTGWVSGGMSLSLDSENKQQGNYCINASGTGIPMFQKVFPAFDTGVTKEAGYFVLYFYISDVTKINLSGHGQIEISSVGEPDQQELNWGLDTSLGLVNGWNKLELKLSNATATGGNINLRAINFIRIYHVEFRGNVDLKIDALRFY
jgi:hypothetical protein